MGFSDTLSNASDEIERRAAIAATETDVKSVMDLLRTFYEEFIEEGSHKVEGKVGTAAPSGPSVSHFGPYLKYLRDFEFLGRRSTNYWESCTASFPIKGPIDSAARRNSLGSPTRPSSSGACSLLAESKRS
jgi:hypothetical protein